MKNLIFVMVIGLVMMGCGNADKAGDKVGGAVTDFLQGMGKGIDKKMLVSVELSDEIKALGLSMTTSKLDSMGIKSLVIYLVSTKSYDGKFIAKAITAEGQEIGRATAEIHLGENDAKNISFSFNQELDTQLAVKYTIGLNQ